MQSESEPHEPHLPLEHLPIGQSESDPHAPHLPPEHLPYPPQSESDPQLPHLPLEHLPYPLQSESDPHDWSAWVAFTTMPNAPRARMATSLVITRRFMMSPSFEG